MKLYSVFFSYKAGNRYNSVYVSLEKAVDVVNEYIDELNAEGVITTSLFPHEAEQVLKDNNDMFLVFEDTSSVTITEISEWSCREVEKECIRDYAW